MDKDLQKLLDSLEQSLDTTSNKFSIFEPVLSYHLRQEQRTGRKRTHWHASDLGGCISGVYYDRLTNGEGFESDDRGLRIMATGTLFHEWIERSAHNAGILVAKEEDLRIFNKQLNASGRADFLIKIGKYHILYDAKTVNSRSFWYNAKGGYKAYDHHVQQLHFYYDHLKDKYENLVMAMLYISKDDFTFQEIHVPHDPQITLKNDMFFTTLEKAWRQIKAPDPEPALVFNQDKLHWEVNWKAKYCKYHHLCTGNTNWLKEAETEAKMRNSVPN